jgi:hypothetical protein
MHELGKTAFDLVEIPLKVVNNTIFRFIRDVGTLGAMSPLSSLIRRLFPTKAPAPAAEKPFHDLAVQFGIISVTPS